VTKIGVSVGIYLGNIQDNSQLRRFTTSENVAKSSRGLFLTHNVCCLQGDRNYVLIKTYCFEVCENAGSSFEVKIETDSNNDMEIETEADSNYITECSHVDKPGIGMFVFMVIYSLHSSQYGVLVSSSFICVFCI